MAGRPPIPYLCKTCGETEPAKFSWYYSKTQHRIVYYKSECTNCTNNRKRPDERRRSLTRIRNPEIAWRYSLKKYGLTEKTFNELFEKQKGLCAVCSIPLTIGREGNLEIEHNHETNTVRGLTCSACNKVLGFAYDSVSILESAIEYLKERG